MRDVTKFMQKLEDNCVKRMSLLDTGYFVCDVDCHQEITEEHKIVLQDKIDSFKKKMNKVVKKLNKEFDTSFSEYVEE